MDCLESAPAGLDSLEKSAFSAVILIVIATIRDAFLKPLMIIYECVIFFSEFLRRNYSKCIQRMNTCVIIERDTATESSAMYNNILHFRQFIAE